ncbi:MAG: sigma-70 family RNA polymerase sigma factor [Erysipelotrichaceae bacterium]|nr:sigma-70 family RNA polymerase sigma factor [Erysipelotrichaceae bacterium]
MAEVNQEHELIKKYHEHDEAAQKELINKYSRLIWKIVYQEYHHYRLGGIDTEDLYQEGLIALHDAIMSYDLTMNIPLYCLAKICISRKIKSYIRRFSRSIYQGSFLCVSLDGQLNDDEGFCLHEVIESKDQYQGNCAWKIDDYLSILNPLESAVILMRIQGFKYAEIGYKLLISRKDVDNTVQRARKKIRKAIAQIDEY